MIFFVCIVDSKPSELSINPCTKVGTSQAHVHVCVTSLSLSLPLSLSSLSLSPSPSLPPPPLSPFASPPLSPSPPLPPQWSEVGDYLTHPSDKPVVLNRSSSTNSINPFNSTYCYGYQNTIFEVYCVDLLNFWLPLILLICVPLR